MGVRGWNSLLVSEGWLLRSENEDGSDQSKSLWMNLQDLPHSSLVLDHIQPIPPGSEFHLDGLGLFFHLHAAAYHRHVSSASLSGTGSMHLLRTFLPLEQLHNITLEFIHALHTAGIGPILVYWDGKHRPPFKAETQLERHTQRDDEWSFLQTYCRSGGRLPHPGRLAKAFPVSPLAQTQVRHTLTSCHNNNTIRMIQCQGEADIEMARAVAGRPNAFALANDTDFCFMANVSYIPFSSLILNNNTTTTSRRSDGEGLLLSALVLQRKRLAESLDLADEKLLVEAALMLGNDYYHGTVERSSPSEVIDFLREQPPSFRVEAPHCLASTRMEFVRNLYELGDNTKDDKKDDNNNIETITERYGPEQQQQQQELTFKPRYNVSERSLEPMTQLHRYDSPRDAIVECLELYLNEDPPDFKREHIQAFLDMNHHREDHHKITLDCPQWTDIVASHIVELTVKHLYQPEILPMEPPYKIFPSAIQFCEALHRNRTPVLPLSSIVERPAPLNLPVDEFENKIIDSVSRNRVTIIEGETGCGKGKSTRVPLMLLKQSKGTKLFIGQPHRLAVKSIVDYLRKTTPEPLNNQIALRMGHGIREYENSNTRAWFVTTGYLVRLLANAPEFFNSVDFLIIDEIHERSVDTDILCLLCKRLLRSNPNIRLVLMSATMASSMYQTYFNAPEPPMQVGSKRYPIKEYFIEDIIKEFDLPLEEMESLKQLGASCEKLQGKTTPPIQYMEKLCESATLIATIVGKPGSSVLIFVPGMYDIMCISERINKTYIPNKRLTCCPIHSDIPIEEQQLVLEKPGMDELKIIVATNVAESSLTIPEVDNVICLGLCKQVSYNPKSHRQMLVPAWISKANAIQRAGRTGRVASGNVFRLYPRRVYECGFVPHECGEMLRIPLDSVILLLRDIIPQSDSISSVLQSCIEPPDLDAIDNSLVHLHKARLTTSSQDSCGITKLGKFVVALGIDLELGCLVGLGIQFGVGAEAIQLAGILTCDKGPWQIVNPLIHETDQFNETMRLTWTNKSAYDKNLHSDGFACMNLVHEFESIPTSEQRSWCRDRGIFFPRLLRMQSICRDLASRVARFLNIDASLLTVTDPPHLTLVGKLTILRIIQVWVSTKGSNFSKTLDSLTDCGQAFPQNIVQLAPDVCKTLYNDIDNHNQRMTISLRKQNGTVTMAHFETVLHPNKHPFTFFSKDIVKYRGKFDSLDPDHETQKQRLWSYASDKGFKGIWYYNARELTVLRKQNFALNDDFLSGIMPLQADSSLYLVTEQLDQRPRGIKERPCGRWIAVRYDGTTTSPGPHDCIWEMVTISTELTLGSRARLQQEFERSATSNRAAVVFLNTSSDKAKEKTRFDLKLYGKGQKITDQDLRDILVSQRLVRSVEISNGTCELIVYSRNTENRMQAHQGTELYSCIPAGARLLFTMASCWRRQPILHFTNPIDQIQTNPEKSAALNLNSNSDDLVSVLLPEHAKLGSLWKTFDLNSVDRLDVVIDSSSIAATAIPMEPLHYPVYAVCGNVLELRNGIKVSNLTVLARESYFLVLALMSFGLISIEDLAEYKDLRSALPEPSTILSADSFNKSCQSLGETLTCFPDKVLDLLRILCATDENVVTAALLKNLESNPFTASNLLVHQKAYKNTKHETTLDKLPTSKANDNSPSIGVKLDSIHRVSLEKLFNTNSDERLQQGQLFASNLMSLIIKSHRGSPVCVDEWEIRTVPSKSSSSHLWFARWACTNSITYLPSLGGCAWNLALTNQRPSEIHEALQCLPPKLRPKYFHMMRSTREQGEQQLVFVSLEVAIQMEAVFWLERQFHTPHAHWYQRGSEVHMMIEALNKSAGH